MAVIAKVLILIVMAASPVYVFESGIPQPSDFVATLYIAVVMVGGVVVYRWPYPIYGMPAWYILLVAWVAVINLAWAIALSSDAFLMPLLFYVYNLLVVLAVVMCLRHIAGFQEWLSFAISIGLIVSGFGVIYSLETHIRPAGFFNNPNQLAYYSLLGLCALILSSNFRMKASPAYAGGIAGAILGIFAAASLAAWGGLLVLVSAVAMDVLMRKGRGAVVVCILVVLSGALIHGVNIYSDGEIVENIERRINRLDHKVDDVFMDRKYDRITHNVGYIIFGAGEGEYETRFYPYVSTEIHSSIGTMLFAYGIIGLSIFFSLIIAALRRAPLPVWVAVAAPLVYSVTHMGLRTTLFWVLIAMVWFKYSDVPRRSMAKSLKTQPG